MIFYGFSIEIANFIVSISHPPPPPPSANETKLCTSGWNDHTAHGKITLYYYISLITQRMARNSYTVELQHAHWHATSYP